jgi:hypothetical protein
VVADELIRVIPEDLEHLLGQITRGTGPRDSTGDAIDERAELVVDRGECGVVSRGDTVDEDTFPSADAGGHHAGW